jgi:hypothetical protein
VIFLFILNQNGGNQSDDRGAHDSGGLEPAGLLAAAVFVKIAILALLTAIIPQPHAVSLGAYCHDAEIVLAQNETWLAPLANVTSVASFTVGWWTINFSFTAAICDFNLVGARSTGIAQGVCQTEILEDHWACTDLVNIIATIASLTDAVGFVAQAILNSQFIFLADSVDQEPVEAQLAGVAVAASASLVSRTACRQSDQEHGG